MALELHPDAKANFDAKIKLLVDKVRYRQEPSKKAVAMPDPNIPVVKEFDESSIIGEIKFHGTDSDGNISSRFFFVRQKMFGISGDDYQDLLEIAEGIKRVARPKKAVGTELLSSIIFEWIQAKFFGKRVTEPTDYILKNASGHIVEAEIWIPISNLRLQSEVALGKVSLKRITKDFVDSYEKSVIAKLTNEADIQPTKEYFKRKRSEIQNLTAAVMNVEGEDSQAYEIAYEETERAMSILRFFSPTNLFPRRTCYTAPIERQHKDGAYYLVVKDGRVLKESSGFADQAIMDWIISDKQYGEYLKTGLSTLNSLINLDSNKLNDFQRNLLDALYYYSLASMSKDVSDRLVYVLIALETVFLKDENEPIVDNIALRIAYMHPVSADERLEIIANIKKIYKLRSSYLHHGSAVNHADVSDLKAFCWNVWMSLQGLIPLAGKGIDRKELFEGFERRRASG